LFQYRPGQEVCYPEDTARGGPETETEKEEERGI